MNEGLQPPSHEGDVVGAPASGVCPDPPLWQAQGGQHAGPSGQPEEDLGPGLSVLGGLLLLFVLENMLGLLRRRGLRPVSDTLFSSFHQTQNSGQHQPGEAPRVLLELLTFA